MISSGSHPFRLRVFRGDDRGFNLCIYIWNCTHGGGSARAKDEFRIQFTSVVPKIHAGEVTLLLGWHDGYGVFVGWDITKHDGQDSKSPSAQVKESALSNAHGHAFSLHHRHNEEIVVAFRPEFLVDYALNAESLHKTGNAANDLSLFNSLDTITDKQIGEVENKERQTILSQIVRKYRDYDFRRRVLGAYEHQCAACGVQLELIDAAHIVPVADRSSTDETKNGVALCKLHHAAFDRNLISFDEQYKIEVSNLEIKRLQNINLAGGITEFKQYLRTAIILPVDKRDYPDPSYIRQARLIRNWATA
ncbi:MAG: HNH endonuclease [Elusimicrobiales bacterium]|nr:HNH endonuclease [Elusimicrobiales bacterium]